MSTRWYPLYQMGAPQLRVFLPNFWMKLIKPTFDQPPNIVHFTCSMEMTRHDVKNYLEKIYDVKSIEVRTRIVLGQTKRDAGKGYVTKEDDTKMAYVILPKEEKFVFPNLFPEEIDKQKTKVEDKTLEEAKKGFEKFVDRNKERPNTPGWFSL